MNLLICGRHILQVHQKLIPLALAGVPFQFSTGFPRITAGPARTCTELNKYAHGPHNATWEASDTVGGPHPTSIRVKLIHNQPV